MKKLMLTAIILMAILLASCNLDSNQGVFQMAHNATHKTEYDIIDVFGAYNDGTEKLLINRDGDIWSVWVDDTGIKQEQILDLTKETMHPVYVTHDGTLYYAYAVKDGNTVTTDIRFGSVLVSDIDESFSYADESHLIPGGLNELGVTSFWSTNLNLDECLIVYGTDKETNYCKITDKRTASSLSLSGKVNLTTNLEDIDTRAATIFGTDALFVYYEDSDLENTPDKLAVIRVDGTSPEAVTLGVDEDNIPMGYDGGYFITFDGDLYQFNTSENGYGRISGFVSDLRYRINHRLVLSNEGNRAVGFIYRNGVYVRENTADNVRPRVLSIDNNDNDIISASYIGHRTAQDGDDWYLFATQNNSFIILEVGPGTLNDEGTRYNYTVSDSMLQSYEPQIHGQLSAYIN